MACNTNGTTTKPPPISANTAWIFSTRLPRLKIRIVLKTSTRNSEYGEERSHVIGMAHGSLLFVVITLRTEESCRIISARKARRHEQDAYYASKRETW